MKLRDYSKSGNLLIGRGFPWQPEHVEALQRYRNRYGDFPLLSDGNPGTPALHGVGAHAQTPIVIPQEVLRGHLSIQGSTGSGKSVLLTNLIMQAIYRPDGAVVVVDPRGDDFQIAHIIAGAHAASRKLRVFAPYFADIIPRELMSNFNPLSTCSMPEEIVARIRPMFSMTREPFWIEKPLETILLMAKVHKAIGKRWTLQDLYYDIMIEKRRVSVIQEYMYSIGVRGTDQNSNTKQVSTAYEKSNIRDILADECNSLLKANLDHFESTMSNYATSMAGIVGSHYSRLLYDVPSLSWEEISSERLVVLVLSSSMLLGDIGSKIGRLILQDAMGHFGYRLAASSVPVHEPVSVFIDEAARVSYPGLSDQLAMARGANGRFVAAWQSRAGMIDAMGPHRARELFDNFNTQVYARLEDAETQEEASKGFGMCKIQESSVSAMREYGGDGDDGNRLTHHQKLTETALIDPSWFSRLPTGHVFMRYGGAPYKVQVPLLPPADLDIVRRLGLDQLIHELRKLKEQPHD